MNKIQITDYTNNIENVFKNSNTEKYNRKEFSKILENTIGEVNRLQKEADDAIEKIASGKEKDIHQTMIALEKAEISFQLMMQLRNKIVSAYEEVMRMQI